MNNQNNIPEECMSLAMEKEIAKALFEYSCEMTRFCNLLSKQLDLILERKEITRESIEYIRDIVDCRYKATTQYQTMLNLMRVQDTFKLGRINHENKKQNLKEAQ
jgi:hypothetical protein